MFVLVTVSDDLRVEPSELARTPAAALTSVIERRYLDRVIPGTGLVVTLYDLVSISGGHIYPNDGAAYFEVVFRLVVFRPFRGEVLLGSILHSTPSGIKVSLGFFEDVDVPQHALMHPSTYDEAERVWVWDFEGTPMYMDAGHPIRIKVSSVRYNTPPTPAQMRAAVAAAAAKGQGPEQLPGSVSQPFAVMEVVGEVNADGLGLVEWWQPAGEEGAEGEDMDGDPSSVPPGG